MKWVAISGSWRKTNDEIEEKVRSCVREIVGSGDGVVTGGALNVDYFASDEILKLGAVTQLKVVLPTRLSIYSQHYRIRAIEGVITPEQAERLIKQLEEVKSLNPDSLIENPINTQVDRTTYFERNSEVIKLADELYAFSVNGSEGVRDAIEKARKKGILVKKFDYKLE